jgi:hypothetical protein
MQESLRKQQASLEKQAGSVRSQVGPNKTAEDASFFLPPVDTYPQADCPPLPPSEVRPLIESAAKKNSLPASLLQAVIRQESGFRPCALSSKGAEGLMQLMPATSERFQVADPFDPERNVDAGAAFLRSLLNKYKGDVRMALIAYNAGESRADTKTDDLLPLETQGYLANIFADLGIQEVEASTEPQDKKTEPTEQESAANPN